MDVLDLVMYLEQPSDDEPGLTDEELLEAIAEHKDELRQLQGSYGRMVAHLEREGRI